METSLSDFKTKGIYNKQGKTMKGSFGIKTSEAGAYAPNEYGNAVLYGFLPQYSKMNACAAHTRTVNYEIRDPALRVGGG